MIATIRTRWSSPEVGGASFESLVRARRFDEAARVMDLDDWTQRTHLAIMRGGPAPDLLHAKNYPPSRRLSARAIRTLERTHGAALVGPTFLGAYVGDDGAVLHHKVDRLLHRGHFARAARVLEDVARRWPQADDVAETRERLVYAWALAGDVKRAHAHAAALSVDTDDAATSARMTRVAEGLHRRMAATASSDKRIHDVARTKKFREARYLRYEAFHKSPSASTLYPGVLELALKHLGRDVGYIPFSAREVADALTSGHVAHVGILDGANVKIWSIQAIDSESGATFLSNGHLVDWENLRSLSLWGDRVVVSRRNGVGVPTVGHNPAVVFPALDGEGNEIASRDACNAARAEVDTRPDDPLAAFVYWRLLLQAGPELAGHPTMHEFGAVCTARHPGMRWPEMAVAIATDGSEADAAHDLYTIGSPDHFRVEASVAMAHARLGGLADWTLISRAQLADPHGLAPLQLGIDWALATGRARDVDAHLDAIERLHPTANDLRYWRVLREIVWRGGRDAYPILACGHLSDEPGAAVGLALHSGSSTYLAEATERLRTAEPASLGLSVAQAVAALHRGDAVAAVEIATRAASAHGWIPPLAEIVNDVVTHEVGDAELAAVGEILTGPPADGTTAFGMFALLALDAKAPDLALSLSRAHMASGAWDAAVRHATVILALSRVGAADREEASAALASVATSADPAVHRAVACAVALESDADEAWDMVGELSAGSLSFTTHLLVAAIATARSDAQLADIHLARAANPRLAEDGWHFARWLGITPWAERAIARIDPRLAPNATVGLYGEGATVTSLPPIPAPRHNPWPLAATDRLALEGDLALMVAATKHRWPALDHMRFVDGTRTAAAHALGLALAGHTEQLETLVSESRHAAIRLAAYAAARVGVNVPWSPESVAATLPILQRRAFVGGRS